MQKFGLFIRDFHLGQPLIPDFNSEIKDQVLTTLAAVLPLLRKGMCVMCDGLHNTYSVHSLC